MTSSLKESYIFNETMAQTSSNGAGPSTGFDSLPRGVWEAIFYQVSHGGKQFYKLLAHWHLTYTESKELVTRFPMEVWSYTCI